MRLVSKTYIRLAGWKIEGAIPPDIKKCVLLAVPHTSNYDFPIALGILTIMDIRLKYLIKKEWMKFPLNLFFKATGAIPVDRKKNTNLIAAIIDIINNADEMVVVIPPEGTRKMAQKWKLGFYYIALGANVPIVLSYLDYEQKVGGIGPAIYPTGNLVEDLHKIRDFYKDKVPRHPEKVSLEII
jgi:1-acyl-sn-glycerol-3-phosphate acyltransferase